MDIDPAQWQRHVDQDEEQSRDIRDIRIAVFGCKNNPETIKNALVPTMQRLNNWLDVWRFIGRAVLAIVITSPAWVLAARYVIKELAK